MTNEGAEPVDRESILATAINLMGEALDLLDLAEEDFAACHLQHAISIATREPVTSSR